MTEMNSFYGGSFRLNISLDLMVDDFAMQYSSVVDAQEDRAIWNGDATVYFLETYFIQDCTTYLDAGISRKAWRTGWLESDASSPLDQIDAWHGAMADGYGYYEKKPMIPADIHEAFEDLEGSVYSVTLRDTSVDWNALCDVDLDLLFGGNDLLMGITRADVMLLYGSEDLKLKGIRITQEENGTWVGACITMEPADGIQEFDIAEFLVSEGYASDEWSIYYEEEKSA